ncbi:MAG: hypothetical protein IT425_14800 [Pirellulales bacterium]|nr:hypothetical protein [Pirellulales bacterium]
MTTAELRQSAKDAIDTLPLAQLKMATEFLRFLDERMSEEATEELLRIPGLLEDLKEAERDVAEGRTVDWREVRRDVSS